MEEETATPTDKFTAAAAVTEDGAAVEGGRDGREGDGGAFEAEAEARCALTN